MRLKLTRWNPEWFGQLLQGKTRTLPLLSKTVTKAADKTVQEMERTQIAEEIRMNNPDTLCIQEGSSGLPLYRFQTLRQASWHPGSATREIWVAIGT